jgi:hypothetical protein
MVYNSFQEFEPHFSAAQSAAHSFHKTSKTLPNVAANDAWNLYRNTKSAALEMQIFGRHIFDAETSVRKFMKETPSGTGRQMPDFMVGITNIELDNFGKANDESSGSALLAGRDKWNFTINDVWLLGGVHGLQPFHPASPINFRNVFHNQFFLTITGRELLGLALAGYKEVPGNKSVGGAYVPDNKSAAKDLTLLTYQTELSKITSLDAAQKFFEKAGYTIQ